MRVLRYIGGGLCAALLLWIALSWADIVADNNYPNPQHSEYNFFALFKKQVTEIEMREEGGVNIYINA